MRVAVFIKGLSVAAAALVALSCMAAASAPAQARDGWNGAIAGGAAAGILGGLAIGAMARQPRPVYVEPETVYVQRPRLEPVCHFERRRVWIGDGEFTYRRVEVCE